MCIRDRPTILSMKTVFPAVLTIHHFRCGVKEADHICGANFLPWSLYVQKWNGNTILPTGQNVAYVIVTIHVHLLPADEWSTFILKRTFVPKTDTTFRSIPLTTESFPQKEGGEAVWVLIIFTVSNPIYFIFGHTNFMVGSLLRKWDLLPSRRIGSDGSWGQQGIPFSLTV